MIKRCQWVAGAPLIYQEYHDQEWGRPVYDDCKLYEMFLLETFQAGLSWLTILKKRLDFAEAFDQYDVKKIACYDERKIVELMNNQAIIRNKRKIVAAINNAKVFIAIQNEFGTFAKYLWSFTNYQVIKNQDDQIKTTSALSNKISADLKRRGMSFVGSITIYSYLQAVGVVNDHETTCFCYKEIL